MNARGVRCMFAEWPAAARLRPSRLSEFSSPALHLQGFSARLVVGADTDRERQPHGDGGSAVTDERDWAQTAFAAEQLLPGVRMLARVVAVGPGYCRLLACLLD